MKKLFIYIKIDVNVYAINLYYNLHTYHNYNEYEHKYTNNNVLVFSPSMNEHFLRPTELAIGESRSAFNCLSDFQVPN